MSNQLKTPYKLLLGHEIVNLVGAQVKGGSAVYTDALASYDGLAGQYDHQFVDHAVEYVRGRVHT